MFEMKAEGLTAYFLTYSRGTAVPTNCDSGCNGPDVSDSPPEPPPGKGR